MKPWIPYIVAGAVGLGIAVAAFPVRGGKDAQAERAARRAERRAAKDAAESSSKDGTPQRTTPDAPAADAPTADVPPTDPSAEAGPPAEAPPAAPETQPSASAEPSRPPFARHVAQTGPYFAQVAKEVAASNEALSLEVVAVARYLRDQANLEDVDVERALGKQEKVIARVRATSPDPRLTGVLDYLEASGNAAKRGADPAAVPPPKQGRPAE